LFKDGVLPEGDEFGYISRCRFR